MAGALPGEEHPCQSDENLNENRFFGKFRAPGMTKQKDDPQVSVSEVRNAPWGPFPKRAESQSFPLALNKETIYPPRFAIRISLSHSSKFTKMTENPVFQYQDRIIGVGEIPTLHHALP